MILCGGMGTRLREETEYRPKPMVPIGKHPILWHIMKTYSHFGHNDFLLALGYKGEQIKDYFLNYEFWNSDFTLDLGSKQITRHAALNDEGGWRITFVDTGPQTATGGRLKCLQPYLGAETSFMLTYGDGVSDVDIAELVAFHQRSGCAATVTGVLPLARFGELEVEGERVIRFAEKPEASDVWVNGGYFVMTPRVFDYIEGEQSQLEREPLERMAVEGELAVFKHTGFWYCMDTYRDVVSLNERWMAGDAPWKRWD